MRKLQLIVHMSPDNFITGEVDRPGPSSSTDDVRANQRQMQSGNMN